MIKNMIKFINKPKVYEKGVKLFWEDEYISKQLLKAHLNPEIDSASRNLKFVEQSSKWIYSIAPSLTYRKLLDLGCGPGLYTERFCKLGYEVTGMDISKKSIKYAEEIRKKENLNIRYINNNYLNMDFKDEFDLITLIYCDYGALSKEDRKILLRKIYKGLKTSGRLMLDVFSINKYNNILEYKEWDIAQKNGFWSNESYIELKSIYKYLDNIVLEQYIIITDNNINNYYIWTSYYTKEKLIEEMEEVGFKVIDIYSNLKGEVFSSESETISIVVEK